MIGAAIAGAIGLGSAVLGGLASSKRAEEAARIQREHNKRQQAENQSWYDRRYNEDPTQKADAQRILQVTSERLKERNKAAAGKAAVMGASEASVAAEKEANAKAMAEVAGDIAARGEARKDAVEERYLERKNGLDDADAAQRSAEEMRRSENIAKAAQGVTAAAGAVAGGLASAGSGAAGAGGAEGLLSAEELAKRTGYNTAMAATIR